MKTFRLRRCPSLRLVIKLSWALLFLLPLIYFLDFGLTTVVTTTTTTTTTTMTTVGRLTSTTSPSSSLSGTKNHTEVQRPATNAMVAKVMDIAHLKVLLEEDRRKRWLMRKTKEGDDKAGGVEEQPQGGADAYLRRLRESNWNYHAVNQLNVVYKGQRRPQQPPSEILCSLKTKARVLTLDGTEEPFSSLGWAHLVPSRPLDKLQGSEFKSCAVVSSAASILRSSLGKEIDSHDAVLRLNAAPTEGFERDVGTKTTIRLINSQVMTHPDFFFNTSSLYQNVALVAWDPPPYSLDLNKWYKNPDYDLFGPYEKRRHLRPQEPFYILHPRFIWQLWDVVQGNTREDIQPNPPSSGFIGIVLMMALCREVHVYEYVPSVRRTARCHYHEKYMDYACTIGAYHPLRYEKALVRKVNKGPNNDVWSKGKVTLPGFSNIHCKS